MEFTLIRNRQSDRKTGGGRGDPTVEALSYKQVSRGAMHLRRKASGSPTSVARSFAKQSCKRVREPLPLSLVIVKTPCGQRVILREAEKKRRSRFTARKAWRGIEGRNRRASGARGSSEPSRSESEAEHVWNVTPGTWEVCGAKALQKSDEPIVAAKWGNARGYPPSEASIAKQCR